MSNFNELMDEILATERRPIYLDHAATTPLDPQVKAAMEGYWSEHFGNPGGFYELGLQAKEALTEARQTVAEILSCQPDEIIFTGSGTEADNLAVFGVARARAAEGRHIITTKIEHHAILHPVEQLIREGFEVDYVPVDSHGLVDFEELKRLLRADTTLVSIIYANNEIGTLQDIPALTKVIKENSSATFHIDACQAAGLCDISVDKLGVDLLTINGSKIYGPKGIGALFVKNGVSLKPLIYGGGQESNRRSGTENIPLIVGFTKALELVQGNREQEVERLTKLRDHLIDSILQKIPKAILNGHPTQRLANNVSVSFPDIEGESLILILNELGVYAATGSACSSASLEPSHVLLGLGQPAEVAHGSLRLTLGHSTTPEDIDYVLTVLPKVIAALRTLSPLDLQPEDIQANLNELK